MKSIQFEWDPKKDRSNQKKHRVPFSEGQTVFHDENAIEFFDPDHSEEEDRYLLLGLSDQLRILIVNYLHIEGKAEDRIRIVSARKATKNEQKVYMERWR